ncbi:MAG: hypothetical protein ONB11_07815 [candidate division KSB1 bacterium]|nr:hypothetical protein [candidate division KSB1 bacterium]MDZ7342313.1 hypothetical protein [candidate division KSB1 bacterium]
MNKFNVIHCSQRYLLLAVAIVLGAASLMISYCGKKKASSDRTKYVLAQIGNKTITADEFIRRAEYTIRPPYCKGDNYIHRKIVLNSLIAEKLLALEAGDDNELTRNEQFQLYLQGRKEQAMRQWLYHDVAYQHATVDSAKIKKVYDVAGRKYRINYVSLSDSNQLEQFKRQLLAAAEPPDSVFRHYFGLDTIPQREISWSDQDDPAIHQALFSQRLTKGEVVGPLAVGNGQYVLMQIDGWTDRLAISDRDIQQRWNDVAEYLKIQQANQIYGSYIANVMKGKRVEFARETFFKLAQFMAPFFLKSQEDKKEAFTRRFWKDEMLPDSLSSEIDEIMNHSLLTIDGQTWQVSDFLKEMMVHPLVFRKRKFSQREFPEQFKLAIVDMIRDKYLTQEAYKKNLDRVNGVVSTTNMWRDYLLAQFQKNRYLQSQNAGEESDYMKLISNYLNRYVDSLQAKYHDQIEINTDKFEKIELTRIDMFVLQRNVPFPIVVPSFPLLTTDNRLDYGRKMTN